MVETSKKSPELSAKDADSKTKEVAAEPSKTGSELDEPPPKGTYTANNKIKNKLNDFSKTDNKVIPKTFLTDNGVRHFLVLSKPSSKLSKGQKPINYIEVISLKLSKSL